MAMYSRLPAGYARRQVIDSFGGYNHNMKIGDGEFYDMKNLTSDYFPLLASRPKRSVEATLTAPHGLLGKSQLAYIDGTRLYYGGLDLTTYLQGAGFSISQSEGMLPKQLVSMGAYIVIYPDRLYINTENFSDCGSMEARFTTYGDVSYSLCKSDGTAYTTPIVSVTAPADPDNGALWIDTSGEVHSLKQYNEATGSWVDIPTVYTKIHNANLGKAFSKLDGVTISGCSYGGDNAARQEQIAALNGSHILYDKGDDYIVVTGLLDAAYTQTTGAVTVSRTVPDMDFITEANNRLWGCKYGLVNGKTVNEIYCCALGDFKNWQQFLGLSTDSYAASVGTDGPWSGAVTHLGYPIFFKEHCLHKVYVSASGAHQIVDTACRGVQKGSHNSLAVVNETLYYKSQNDVCAYDGSLPVSVSGQLGGVQYSDAAAGAMGDKYYISMKDGADVWHLFVLDTAKGFWHKEDNTHVLQFARRDGRLYFLREDGALVAAVGGQRASSDSPLPQGSQETDIEWMAETGLVGYTTVERKYVSRFNLRMKLPVGSHMDVYIQYDSEGPWYHVGHVNGTGVNTFMIPVRPRRCDHFRIRITGRGDVRVYSFAKVLETGSDVG